MVLLKIILSAILNRCRGSQWFSFIPSTGLGRLLACLSLAIVNFYSHPFFIPLATVLFLNWAVWAWDVYWAAAAGHKPEIKPAFIPVDWILSKLPLTPGSRAWGIIGMGLRQGICGLPIFMLQYYLTNNIVYLPLALIPFLFGIPYAAFSYITKSKFVEFSEYFIGAIWGLIL